MLRQCKPVQSAAFAPLENFCRDLRFPWAYRLRREWRARPDRSDGAGLLHSQGSAAFEERALWRVADVSELLDRTDSVHKRNEKRLQAINLLSSLRWL